jgi:hypothetical protein
MRLIPPKRRLTFKGLRCVIYQKTELLKLGNVSILKQFCAIAQFCLRQKTGGEGGEYMGRKRCFSILYIAFVLVDRK